MENARPSTMHVADQVKRSRDTIYYDPSLTGKGKTHGLLSELAKGHGKTLIAVPSLDLANDYKKKIKEMTRNINANFLYQVVTSEDKKWLNGFKTREKLQKHIDRVNNGQSLNNLVITTHETLDRAFQHGMTGLDGWSLYIDESMDMYKTNRFHVSKMAAGMFFGTFDFKKSTYTGLMEVHPSKEMRKNMLAIVNGEVKDSYWSEKSNCDFLRYILSPSFLCLIHESSVDELSACFFGENGIGSVKLMVLSTLNPNVLKAFSSVTILSALYKRNIMAKVLGVLGFSLVDKRYASCQKEVHDNGDRLTIYYAIESKNSITYKSKKVNKNSSLDNEDIIVREYLDRIGGQDFIYNANIKSRNKKEYSRNGKDGDNEQGILLTAVAGVNSYQSYHNALYTTARNLDDSESSVLQAFGIDKDFANDDRNLLAAYQFISRTSIRNPTATEPVSFYVIDKNTADFIHSLWPNSSVQKVDISHLKDKAPSIHASNKKKGGTDADYDSYVRVKRRFNGGWRVFHKPTRKRFISMAEKLGDTDDDVYDFIKNYNANGGKG